MSVASCSGAVLKHNFRYISIHLCKDKRRASQREMTKSQHHIMRLAVVTLTRLVHITNAQSPSMHSCDCLQSQLQIIGCTLSAAFKYVHTALPHA